MTGLTLRATGVFCALAAISASLLAPTSTAVAATTVEAAASAFGRSTFTVTEVRATGDITKALTAAVLTAGDATVAHLVHLPAGALTLDESIHPADNVYLVADPGTTVTWRGTNGYALRFANTTGGVYGGTWNGAGRASTTLIGIIHASVQVHDVTVTRAGQYGIVARTDSTLTLRNVIATANRIDGVHIEASHLDADGVRATGNRRNGVQLSVHSDGTIANSVLDSNGQAVSGSTTGKIGHGLGVAASSVTVASSSMSSNKVCGVSLSESAHVTINGSHLDHNGRHGLGTTAGATATISDSWVTSNGYHGVLASGKGTHVTLNGVTISGAARSGVSVPTKGKLTLLGGNTVSASRSHGITVSGKGSITITGLGNLITGSRGDGLRITGSGTTGRISAKASFVKNHGSGIAVVSKARLAMVTCVFSGNNRHGIEKRSGGRVTKLG